MCCLVLFSPAASFSSLLQLYCFFGFLTTFENDFEDVHVVIFFLMQALKATPSGKLVISDTENDGV